MKKCPQCRSTDVPDSARQCPYCLYWFEEPKQTNESNNTAADRQTAEKENREVLGGLASRPESTKVLGEKKSSEGKTGSGSAEKKPPLKREQKETPRYKKPVERGILLGAAAVIAVLFIIVEILSNADSRSVSMEPDESPSSEETVSEETMSAVTKETIPYADEYILPTSNSAFLTEADLEGLAKEQLRIARNEIYARHGRKFHDNELQSYFDAKEWYEGTIAPEDFTDAYAASVFNDYEMKNKDFIANYESTH